jgi:hypothetical protein
MRSSTRYGHPLTGGERPSAWSARGQQTDPAPSLLVAAVRVTGVTVSGPARSTSCAGHMLQDDGAYLPRTGVHVEASGPVTAYTREPSAT